MSIIRVSCLFHAFYAFFLFYTTKRCSNYCDVNDNGGTGILNVTEIEEHLKEVDNAGSAGHSLTSGHPHLITHGHSTRAGVDPGWLWSTQLPSAWSVQKCLTMVNTYLGSG